MESSYNSRCPAVKRLFREAKELNEATEEYNAQPLEDNLFEWHFTVRGPVDSEFDGGIYHGRIIMPADYPMKPPNIIFLTPNGRFETNKKICLSISGHHPETWQPSWSIRTALLAIIGFMPTPANGTIGSLDYTASERATLARKSQDYECPQCGSISSLLKERTSDNKELQDEARKVMGQVAVSVKTENSKEGSEEGAGVEEGSENSKSSSSGVDEATAGGHCGVEEEVIPSTSHADTGDPQCTDNGGRDQQSTSPAPEILMEGATTNNIRIDPDSTTISSQGYLYNTVLSAAIFLLIGLVIRRIFLLEGDTSEELDEILL
ncbi:hypothetical protein Pcinc_006449 [Petrolisthes cinctipes]|uniref:UBC core domain-containing protein n=1 Tax=Petrolisthes cinctipes TaxID=88211 RepID=A0AAE1GCU8_PETCI|nr:hypothetical protein Pcinc_006449 [Petrolisthes cinctipes]